MGIINNIKEDRQKDKEEFYKRLDEAKAYTKESFNKENRNMEIEIKKAILTSPEIKEFTKTQYKTHMQLIMAGIVAMIFGFIFIPIMIVALILLVSGLVCMVVNRNRINKEHRRRKEIEGTIRKRLTEPSVDEDIEV